MWQPVLALMSLAQLFVCQVELAKVYQLIMPASRAQTAELVCRTQAKRSWTTAPTRIPVPPGTVVKRKRGGTLIADLTHPGSVCCQAPEGIPVSPLRWCPACVS